MRSNLPLVIFSLMLAPASLVWAADDPFAPENELKPPKAQPQKAEVKQIAANQELNLGQEQGFPNPLGGFPVMPSENKGSFRQVRTQQIDQLIDWNIKFVPEKIRRGQITKLIIEGKPRIGYHTYPMTKGSSDSEQGVSKLIWEKVAGLQPLWPITETEPTWVNEKGKDEKVDHWLLEHVAPFTWSQDVLVLPESRPGSTPVVFSLSVLVCDTSCVPGFPQFEGKLEVSDEPPVPIDKGIETRRNEGAPGVIFLDPSTRNESGGQEPAKSTGSTANKDSEAQGWGDYLKVLFAFVGSGIFFGAISLLTPCVFPMIPITVSFFLKQSEKEHHRPVIMASVYSLTIVVVLSLGGLLLISILQRVSQHWATNFVLGGLFVFFAFSLFGMYEISLPSGLANLTSAQQGRGGLVGAMFMALTFTLISFTCVAPFYGAFIGLTAGESTVRGWFKLGLGALAFSATFAAPFFLLALFPNLLRKMPKSGSWMNTIKVVMGFLEIAAALKFLRAGELLFSVDAEFLTYDFVLGIYIALSLACGLYLLRVFRLPHDDETNEPLGVPRLMCSLAFLSVGIYLLPALFIKGAGNEKQMPSGAVFAWVNAFLLPDSIDTDLRWGGNLEKGLAGALENHKLVFIDFTGKTCTNCRKNEQSIFSKTVVKDLLKRYDLVQLYTDVVPKEFEPTTTYLENLHTQEDHFGTVQLPLYVIVQPLGKGQFKEVKRYDRGLITDLDDFKRFLQEPLQPGGTVALASP